MKNKEFKVRLVNAKHLGEHQLRDGEVPEPEGGDPGDSGSGDSGSGDSGSGGGTSIKSGSCSLHGSVNIGDVTWDASGSVMWVVSIEIYQVPSLEYQNFNEYKARITLQSATCSANFMGESKTVVEDGIILIKSGNYIALNIPISEHNSGDDGAITVSHIFENIPFRITTTQVDASGQIISSSSQTFNRNVTLSLSISYNILSDSILSSGDVSVSQIS